MTDAALREALEALCFEVMPLRDCLRGDRRARLVAALRTGTAALAGRECAPPDGRGTPRQRQAVALHRSVLDLCLALGVPAAELVPHFNARVESGAGPLSPDLAMARLRCRLAALASAHLEAAS